MSRERNMRGVEGLAEFATDIDSALARTDKILEQSVPAKQRQNTHNLPNINKTNGAAPTGNSWSGWVWLLGSVAVIWVISAIASDDGYENSDDGYYGAENEIPETDYGLEYEDGAMNEYAFEDDGTGDVMEEYGEVPETTIPLESDDEMYLPPTTVYDSSVLSREQLRDCLEESIRLDGQSSAIDSFQFSDPDRYNRNVDSFNSALDQFNLSCENRSFRQTDRSSIESEVLLRRYSIEQEGRSRVN
ncbi:hypothetical protein M3P36_04945 [Altererythrobacter sp. KTW20L]|uniref:hypothetical protein n=1 Tax=Altererythrobacter sp. KTW20L TaxID=2942210 RepID=UPI0020C0C46F|nr:hypothetical protein [Altererythrobacter sp. KTW20L]MCL6250396.1 hypothetical protein [Altererythrobacter sp. KTW20L]